MITEIYLWHFAGLQNQYLSLFSRSLLFPSNTHSHAHAHTHLHTLSLYPCLSRSLFSLSLTHTHTRTHTHTHTRFHRKTRVIVSTCNVWNDANNNKIVHLLPKHSNTEMNMLVKLSIHYVYNWGFKTVSCQQFNHKQYCFTLKIERLLLHLLKVRKWTIFCTKISC